MKKYIFLDHDGVMCMRREQGSRFTKIKRWNLENPDQAVVYVNKADHVPIQIRFDDFNKVDAVRVLNEILLESDADIVVSSDWRLLCTLEEMQEFYKQMGVIKVPIGMTELYSTEWESTGLTLQEQRSIEIERYIEKHKPDKWVALDDMDLSEKFGDISGNKTTGLKNFVKCKPSEGLKRLGIKKKIMQFL
jgi:hypothetical protein